MSDALSFLGFKPYFYDNLREFYKNESKTVLIFKTGIIDAKRGSVSYPDQIMNPSNRFDCHSYLDNTTLAILEISTKANFSDPTSRSYYWLLINKSTLHVKTLQLHSRDDSTYVQERFFDIGYLKYDSNAGVFIPQNSQELHPLENLTCNDIPKKLLRAVENYLCVV